MENQLPLPGHPAVTPPLHQRTEPPPSAAAEPAQPGQSPVAASLTAHLAQYRHLTDLLRTLAQSRTRGGVTRDQLLTILSNLSTLHLTAHAVETAVVQLIVELKKTVDAQNFPDYDPSNSEP